MNKITEITKRDILDYICINNIKWSGRLNEVVFLSRLYKLNGIKSTDSRFLDASGDIWQHRINNSDGEDDWIFYDDRFGLLYGADNDFLKFLCEMLHPAVRPNVEESRRICEGLNSFLQNDGFHIIESEYISGRPVYVWIYDKIATVPIVTAARASLSGTDPRYINVQIKRMQDSMETDPSLAIGTAKELLETCCKTILSDRQKEFGKNADLSELIKITIKELELAPDDIPEKAKASDVIKRLLSNLATIADGIAKLRNLYGTGHGKVSGTKGLQPRHAKLAVGAASTLAAFLAETHNVRKK